MASLNHFSISAGLGSILGPRVEVHHGQLGSSELAATLTALVQRRKDYVAEVEAWDTQSLQYEKAVKQAFLLARDGYSPDRVIADPNLNLKFLKACRDLGLDDSAYHLNLTLLSMRKNNKLKGVGRSRRALVPDQWRYAVASEVAARAMYYRYGLSVDGLLSHPDFVREFDELAESLAPGFTPFQYRWAALNMRKKGASVKVDQEVLDDLDWSRDTKFDASSRLPDGEGVYSLHEDETILYVAGTENIQESIVTQHRIVDVSLLEPTLWRPDPKRLYWRYASMPGSLSEVRYGVVKSLVGEWQPVFNIPRGETRGDGRKAA